VAKQAYLNKGRCITDFIKNMRLISMHQLEITEDGSYNIVLWKEPECQE